MNLSAAIESWSNVLFHPGEPAFAEERQKAQATLSTAIIWTILAAIVSSLLGWLSLRMLMTSEGGLAQMITALNLPPDTQAQFEELLNSGVMGGSSVISIVLSPLFFLLGVGILNLVARLLGGTGNFGRYAYLMASFQAPVTILNAVLNFIPVAGGCLALAFSLYSIVLAYFATKVEHNLSTGRAVTVVLIPVILIVLALFCVIAFAASVLIATQSGSQ